MKNFFDEALIDVASGNGGNGASSFRREKYVPRGGPDGGDGGDGGNAVFYVNKSYRTLRHLRQKIEWRAGNGESGRGRKQHGRRGCDVEIPLPVGSLLRDPHDRQIIFDLTADNQRYTFLSGGRGGLGNSNFATSRNQAPRYAQRGSAGECRQVLIELQMIADIGFVGFPNAGKSSLLAALTNANPKIASYPFTTKSPNLGVLSRDRGDIVFADVPGLIVGASRGVGLGDTFLRHLLRVRVLVFVIDLADDNHNNAYRQLLSELTAYSAKFTDKKRLIVANKMDCEKAKINIKEFYRQNEHNSVVEFSTFSRMNYDNLIERLYQLAEL